MTPIEAMARALDPDAWLQDFPVGTTSHLLQEGRRMASLGAAARALTALRDCGVTVQMLEAVATHYPNFRDGPAEEFRAMLDAALGEK